MNTTNPSSSSNSGRRFGEKIRGVFEVVHGLGENIRGTAMAALDTVLKNDSTRNDEIARQGRLEMERGLTNMGRRTGAQSSTVGSGPTGWPPATEQSLYATSNYDRDPNVVSHPTGPTTGDAYVDSGMRNRMPTPGMDQYSGEQGKLVNQPYAHSTALPNQGYPSGSKPPY